MKTGDGNLHCSQQVMTALVNGGVQQLVLSPGSRSTPLLLAALQSDALQLHVIPDERSAAFFALGLCKAGAPAALLATSGSAAAHWYPAVIEAASGHWPLLLLSADRPPELHACGANQSIDQMHLFGKFCRGFFALDVQDGDNATLASAAAITAQAVDLSRWPLPGPVHINLSFREPLLPESGRFAPATDTRAVQVDYPQRSLADSQLQQLAGQLSGRAGLLIAGATQLDQAEAQALHALARTLDCPLLADPLSGLRFVSGDDSRLVCRYDSFLRGDAFSAAQAPDWVLQFGAVPVSKALQGYLDRHAGSCHQVRVSPVGDWPDPARSGRRIVHADTLPLLEALGSCTLQPAPPEWCHAFRQAEQRVEAILEDPEALPLEAGILTQLLQRLPANSRVFAGNSMVIRDCDSFIGPGPRALTLSANRGASGIDGNVSTLLGMAAADDQLVVGLLGDLALYHDMNGLLAARNTRAILVVFNNGGGAIFSYLPQAQLAEFEQYWLTDTGLEPAAVARLYRLAFSRVETVTDFALAFSEALAASGSTLIEVVIDREDSIARHRAFWSSC